MGVADKVAEAVGVLQGPSRRLPCQRLAKPSPVGLAAVRAGPLVAHVVGRHHLMVRALVDQRLDLLLQRAAHVQAAEVEDKLAPTVLVCRRLGKDIGVHSVSALLAGVDVVDVRQHVVHTANHPAHLLLRRRGGAAKPFVHVARRCVARDAAQRAGSVGLRLRRHPPHLVLPGGAAAAAAAVVRRAASARVPLVPVPPAAADVEGPLGTLAATGGLADLLQRRLLHAVLLHGLVVLVVADFDVDQGVHAEQVGDRDRQLVHGLLRIVQVGQLAHRHCVRLGLRAAVSPELGLLGSLLVEL
mmetsp:Transcript_7407/g.18906  ORF Transcript_7407/g.18906 Transcript_7407/m.18906 type:complete len:300 (+) Transcript_7407:196-1095(+)